MDEAADIAHALELFRQDKDQWAKWKGEMRRTRQRCEAQAAARGVPMDPALRGLLITGQGRKKWSDAHKLVYQLMRVWLRHGHPEPTSTPTGPFIRWIVQHAPEGKAGTPRSLQRIVPKVRERLKADLENEATLAELLAKLPLPPPGGWGALRWGAAFDLPVSFTPPYPRQRAPYRRKQR